MTMPHLMNCGHDDNGWCLDCVGVQYDLVERLRAENERLKTDLSNALNADDGLPV